MSEKYDDVLVPFVSLMRRELHANCGKGDRPGWLRMDANTALLEVYYHLSKLQKAVKHNDGPAIMEYSADVANMAMMVLDICGGLALVDACSSCGGTGAQGNGPGHGGCTDCNGSGERGEPAAMARNEAYDMVDRYLRNNLDDADYAEYSTALEIVWRCPSEFTQWVDRVAETVAVHEQAKGGE